MKGLLIKDFKILLKSKYIFILITLICSMLILAIGKLFFDFKNFPSIIGLIVFFQMISTFFASYSILFILQNDEKCGWDKCEIILPVSKKMLVAEKYIVPYIFVAINALMNSLIFNIEYLSQLTTVGLFIESFLHDFSIGMIIPLMAVPLYYKFGYYKSKFVQILVFIIIMYSFIFGISIFPDGSSIMRKIISMISIQINVYPLNLFIERFSEIFFDLLFIVILNLISYSLSLFFYKRKEF